jgi:hypothetical protein
MTETSPEVFSEIFPLRRAALYLLDIRSGKIYPVRAVVQPEGDAKLAVDVIEIHALIDIISQIGKLVLHDYTTTPLPPNGVFTSAVDDSDITGRIVGTVYSDTRGTLYIEQSPDGDNWDVVTSISIAANIGTSFNIEKIAKYARVRFVNSGRAQTEFRLYIYRRLRTT